MKTLPKNKGSQSKIDRKQQAKQSKIIQPLTSAIFSRTNQLLVESNNVQPRYVRHFNKVEPSGAALK